MNTRIWHGRTREEDADAYLDYIRQTGLKYLLEFEEHLMHCETFTE
jgi:hypothetical protein